MEPIEVLIGDSERRGTFWGFKARFRGEELVAYEAEERVVYRLYRCGWGDYDGYRVYKSDEREPFLPVNELTPVDVEDPEAPDTEYFYLYEANEIVSYYPFFAAQVGFLKTRDIDPQLGRSPGSQNE